MLNSKMAQKPRIEPFMDIISLEDLLESNGYEFRMELEDTISWSSYSIIIDYPYSEEYNNLSICRNIENSTNLPVVYLAYRYGDIVLSRDEEGRYRIDTFYNFDELLTKLDELGVPTSKYIKG